MREGATELTPLVDGTRGFRGDMARDPAGKRELSEQLLHALGVLGAIGIDLTIASLQIGVGNQAWTTVPRPRNVDDVQVVGLDQPVAVDIDEVQPRRCPPMSQQSWLDMLKCQRFFEQGIVDELDLSNGEVIRRAPVGIHLVQLIGTQWALRGGGFGRLLIHGLFPLISTGVVFCWR